MGFQVYRISSSSYQKESFFEKEKEILEKIPNVTYINSLGQINGEDPLILITNTHTDPDKISDSVLERTALVIHPNSGHDNWSIEFLEKYKFPIILGNPIRSHAVAEYILSTLFHHFSAIPHQTFWSEDRTWNRKLLRDQKVLILGHGNVGKIIKKALDALCYKVQVFDPYLESQFKNPLFSEKLEDNMIQNSQIVILAASLNKSNTSFIDEQFLKKLHPECVIINAARGKLIKEDDLIQFLQKHPKSKAYLDVFHEEPYGPSYLANLNNVNKTSHVAGVYDKLNNDIINFEYHIIKDFVERTNQAKIQSFHEDYKSCLLHERIIDNELI